VQQFGDAVIWLGDRNPHAPTHENGRIVGQLEGLFQRPDDALRHRRSLVR